MYNAINFERFAHTAVDGAAKRHSIGIPVGAQLVGTVGRLVAQKGYSVLLEAIPATLESVLLTALARNPDERYASAGAFHAALRDFVLRERMTFRGDQLGEWMRKMFPPRRSSG